MTKARRDSLYLVLLGSTLFVLLGFTIEATSSAAMADFKTVYVGARCLIQHQDPYQVDSFVRVYRQRGGPAEHDLPGARSIDLRYIYLPMTFSFTVPFSLLPWYFAKLLWMAATASAFILASLLIWNAGAEYAPLICGTLIFLLLGNSQLLLLLGNSAGVAISLGVIAAWCFIRGRCEWIGVVCLALSLIIKPHDTGLIWLYFLLAGGAFRKRALQTFFLAVVLSVPAIAWVLNVSPHWMQELSQNLAVASVRGGINDPGPSSSGAHGVGMMINLQEALSFFKNDPHVYNPITYAVFGILFLIWAIHTFRTRPTGERAWFGLAVVAALSLLPVYHRQADAKLLLLTVPACVQLVSEGGGWAVSALIVSGTGILLTGDLFWALSLAILRWIYFAQVGMPVIWYAALQALPTPFILLAIAVFYLWACLGHSSSLSPVAARKTQDPVTTANAPGPAHL